MLLADVKTRVQKGRWIGKKLGELRGEKMVELLVCVNYVSLSTGESVPSRGC